MKHSFLATILLSFTLVTSTAMAAITTDPVEAAFQQALMLRGSGQAADAAVLLESLLAQDPALQRVRLELAVCHEQLGHATQAGRLYQEVLAANPPPAVRRNVQTRLNALAAGMMIQPTADSDWRASRTATAPPNIPGGSSAAAAVVMADPGQQQLRLNGSIAAGMIYDTNVNAGPSSGTVTIFNVPFVLDPTARPTADWGHQARANLQATYGLDRQWSIMSSISYDRMDYFVQNRFDFDRVAGSIGPVLTGATWQTALLAGYGANWLGRQLYSQDVSLTPQWTWQFRPQWTSTLTAASAIGLNNQNSGFTGTSFFLSESVQWTSQDGKTFVRPRLFYTRNNADAEFLASHQAGGGLGFFTMLPGGISFYVEPSAQLAQYDGVEPLYGKTRREPQFVLNVNLSRPLGFWGLEAALGYTTTRNKSNVEQFDYVRSQYTFLIRKGW